VDFAGGDDKLKEMSASLKGLQFGSLAAAGQPLKVLRRATLTCASACSLTLVSGSDAQPPR
jgi:spore coat protein U-like protein